MNQREIKQMLENLDESPLLSKTALYKEGIQKARSEGLLSEPAQPNPMDDL